MKKILICFDVDGTLRNDVDEYIIANEPIRTLLVTLAGMKNTQIVVWSGSGELYARQVVSSLGLKQYVDDYGSKWDARFTPDIAIDDVEDCSLGKVNLICK